MGSRARARERLLRRTWRKLEDFYWDQAHAETRRIAAEQQARLDQARQALQAGGQLSLLELVAQEREGFVVGFLLGR